MRFSVPFGDAEGQTSAILLIYGVCKKLTICVDVCSGFWMHINATSRGALT